MTAAPGPRNESSSDELGGNVGRVVHEMNKTLGGLTWDGSALWTLLTTYGDGSSTSAASRLAVSH